jgi:hypothetical protein
MSVVDQPAKRVVIKIERGIDTEDSTRDHYLRIVDENRNMAIIEGYPYRPVIKIDSAPREEN